MEGFWSLTTSLYEQKDILWTLTYVFPVLVWPAVTGTKGKRACPLSVPWRHWLSGIPLQAVTSPSFSSPCSYDGLSVWPKGTCGHDVHWHTDGLLSGRSLRAYPQVSGCGKWGVLEVDSSVSAFTDTVTTKHQYKRDRIVH